MSSDFKIQNYKVIKKIGEGSFASVYLIEEVQTKDKYAAKIYNSKCDANEDIIKFIEEVKIFSKAKYPTILNFIGYDYKNFKSEPYPMILTEYVPNHSLQSMLYDEVHSKAPIDWSNTSKYIVLFGISLGFHYLQSKKIVHRDIKPENVLLSDNYYPKICDFGLSKIFYGKPNEIILKSANGTPFYMAPEIIQGNEYTIKADVYSFSLVAYQIIACQIAPFKFDTNLIYGAKNKNFFEKCHSNDPSKRPTFYEICCYIATNSFIEVFDKINFDEVFEFIEYIISEKEDDSDSLFFSGLFLLETGKYLDEATGYLKKSADLGNTDAMLKYAQLIKKNKPKSAFDYFRKAADEGNAEAMYNVAQMLDNGIGVEMDKNMAIYYFEKAKSGGYEIPQNKDQNDSSASKIKPLCRNDDNLRNKHHGKTRTSDDHCKKHRVSKNSCNSNDKSEKNTKCSPMRVPHKLCESRVAYMCTNHENMNKSPGRKCSPMRIHKKIEESNETCKCTNHEKMKESVVRRYIPIKEQTQINNLGSIRRVHVLDEPKPNHLCNVMPTKLQCKNPDELNTIQLRNHFNPPTTIKNSEEQKTKYQSAYIKSMNKPLNNQFSLPIASKNSEEPITKYQSAYIKSMNKPPNNQFSLPIASKNSEEPITKIQNTTVKSINNETPKILLSPTIPHKKYENLTKPEKTYSFDEAINRYCMKPTQDSNESSPIQRQGKEFVDMNGIHYNLYDEDITSEVSYSPKSKGDVFIKTYVSFQSNEYKITRICDNAFSNTSIESLSFATNSFVKSFGQSPFNNSSLSTLFIPPDLAEVDSTVFKGTKKLNKIVVDPKNKNFSVNNNGCVYYKGNKLIFVMRCFKGEFVVNDQITSIGSYAFSNVDDLCSFSSNCSKLAKIYPYSFYQCQKLKNVFIQTNELEIDSFSFANSEKLSSIEFNSIQKLKISKNCFADCSKLSKISFSKVDKISIDSEAFNGCIDLKKFVINQASLIILDENCFSGANNLCSLNLNSDSIIFANSGICSISLTDISIQTTQNIFINSKTFENCQSLQNLTISSTSKISVFKDAFNNNFYLKKVNFECNSVSIQNESFVNCNIFDSFSLKAEKEIVIHENSFVNCSSLNDFVVDSSSSLFIYNKFTKSSIKTVCLSAKSITIDDRCFNNCSKLVVCKLKAINSIVLGRDQFSLCNSLGKISIDIEKTEKAKIEFGLNCFSDAKNLNEINLSASNVEILNYTSDGVKSLPFRSAENQNIINDL